MSERRFSPRALEYFEMMKDPARRGPLQSFWTIDYETNSLVQSSQPLAVNSEHLEGDTIVLNSDIAREAFDEAWGKYVKDTKRLKELGHKTIGNHTFDRPVSAEAAEEIDRILGL